VTSQARIGSDVVVRLASAADAEHLLEGVAALHAELVGSDAAASPSARAAAHEIASGGETGLAVVALASGGTACVGVATASIQTAIRTSGPYLLIQELWTAPAYRSLGVGSRMLAALRAEAVARGVKTIEVGMPRRSFPAVDRTIAFYTAEGFEEVGLRMRRSAS
jgi:GNAT superfamily N-acetyltransferase